MRHFGLLVLTIGFLVPFLASAPAHAQATRTWVSGVGDDANPCSRTAPCKTFAGAISKIAASGEINVLDPGGFGAATITKSITIRSDHIEAGVLVSGTNGIVVSLPATLCDPSLHSKRRQSQWNVHYESRREEFHLTNNNGGFLIAGAGGVQNTGVSIDTLYDLNSSYSI